MLDFLYSFWFAQRALRKPIRAGIPPAKLTPDIVGLF